jgi:AcrR family transcriptional regulator|tara:strand:+ start:908 stop:1519 length:612 start_codon:yes stop_codon:yes gene_type:complete
MTKTSPHGARASKKRNHLVATALQLFYENGYHATGIDRILAESGVAKMTLYKHFASKDDLIVAALDLRHQQFLDWFVATLDAAGPNRRDQLLAAFDALGEWFRGAAPTGPFHGCAFIKALGEFPDLEHPVRRRVLAHKQSLRDHLAALAAEAGCAAPRRLANHLSMLTEGAILTAQLSGQTRVAQEAKDIGRLIIDDALAAQG